jgi:phosphoribosylamine--glycine ligase
VIEELMEGPEISVLALCDGERFLCLPPAQDHKRRFDGDLGPNTGGMGAYAPAPVPDGFMDSLADTVIRPVLEGMANEGRVFRGVLYVGVMLTPQGMRVLEFNCRFGDPECQPLLMLLDEDLLPILIQCAQGQLTQSTLAIRSGATCCVVMASSGYPGSVEKGHAIGGLDQKLEGVRVFQAGTLRRPDGVLVNNGGRVLGVTAYGKSFKQARERAYSSIDGIHWKGADWRKDIGWRAIKEGL